MPNCRVQNNPVVRTHERWRAPVDQIRHRVDAHGKVTCNAKGQGQRYLDQSVSVTKVWASSPTCLALCLHLWL